MTYGSLLLAYDIGEKPDLIAAVGTEGQQGYVLREDFDPQFYTQEAARAYAQHLKQDNLIPLYSLDGERIGSYALGTAGRAEETDPVTQARLEKLSAQQPAADLEPLQPIVFKHKISYCPMIFNAISFAFLLETCSLLSVSSK